MCSEENTWGKHPRDLLASAMEVRGPTYDVAAKTSRTDGRADRGQLVSQRGMATLCPGQGKGKVT